MDELIKETVIAYREEEVADALERLRKIQNGDGFFTEATMKTILGHKMSSYLKDRYTIVTEYLPNGLSYRILSPLAGKLSYGREAGIFDDIYGYVEIKARFTKILNDDKRGACELLYGASRVGKTLFMEAIVKLKRLKVIHISGDPKECSLMGITSLVRQTYEEVGSSNFVILIDELDKVPEKDQIRPQFLRLFDADETRALLNVKSTREGESNSTYMPLPALKVFAGANKIGNIGQFLINRFNLVPFPEYTPEAFIETAVEMLLKKYRRTKELAYEMARYYAAHGRNMGRVDMNGDRFNTVEEFRQWTIYEDKNADQVKKQDLRDKK